MAISPGVDVTSEHEVTADGAPVSRTRMIVVLGALVALGPLTLDLYLPALPRITEELSVTSSVTQLTLTGTLAGLAFGQLIVGPLSDSLGRRKPLIVGIVLHMLASVVCLLAPNITVLGIGRVLQGIGASAAMVVAIAVAAICSRIRPPRRCCPG
jgi:DHA1 family bicyclomycin/chloramphenicol resistance-like MFS transporter